MFLRWDDDRVAYRGADVSSEDRANVLGLLAANRNGDTDGFLAVVANFNHGELIGAVIALVSVLDAVCSSTVWRDVPNEAIDAMLQAILGAR